MPVLVDGRWQGPTAAGLCKTADLSLGGCFVRTASSPAIEEPVLVTLFFARRGAMPLPGHVVRVEPGLGFAVRFDDMRQETRYRLGEEITQIRRRTPPTLLP